MAQLGGTYLHQPAHRSLGGKAGDNVRRRLCFGVRGWTLGPRAVHAWHLWLSPPASSGSPRRRSDSLSLLVWSGPVRSAGGGGAQVKHFAAAAREREQWTKEIESKCRQE